VERRLHNPVPRWIHVVGIGFKEGEGEGAGDVSSGGGRAQCRRRISVDNDDDVPQSRLGFEVGEEFFTTDCRKGLEGDGRTGGQWWCDGVVRRWGHHPWVVGGW
jgi:hypothetical protein